MSHGRKRRICKKKGVVREGFGQIKTLFNLGVIKSVVNRMEAKKYNYVDGSTFISHLLSRRQGGGLRATPLPIHFSFHRLAARDSLITFICH